MTPTEFKSRLESLEQRRSTYPDKLKFAIAENKEEIRKHDDAILKWGINRGYTFQDYDWSESGVRFGDSVEYDFYTVLGQDAAELYNKFDQYDRVNNEYWEIELELKELESEFAGRMEEYARSLGCWEDPEVSLCFNSLFITDVPSGTGGTMPIQGFLTWLEKNDEQH